jgi:hypothetical protein
MVEENLEEDLAPGPARIKMRFAASALRAVGIVGPFNIARISITHAIPEGRGLDYDRFDAGLTQRYDLSGIRP